MLVHTWRLLGDQFTIAYIHFSRPDKEGNYTNDKNRLGVQFQNSNFT